MRKNAGLIKNIIMVVASALTLVAVSFAWFTSNFATNLDSYKAAISGETLVIDFYQENESGKYQPLAGDIELNDFVPGSYNKYKFLITTKTADKLKIKFSIDSIPEDIPQELEDYVCIKYSMYTTKVVETGENLAHTDKVLLAKSDDFVSLSELNDGVIFSNFSLSNYQKASGDTFVIYYEIGLSEDAPASVSGLESSLGKINISAQRIG